MQQICRHLRQYSGLKHLLACLCLISMISSAYAQFEEFAISGTYNFRAPASFNPDDDVIVVPVYVEKSFMERVTQDDNGELKPRVYSMKQTMDQWQNQNEFILNWSLQGTGYTLPNEVQKRQFFERQFFRYLTRKGGEPYKQDLKEWWEQNDDSQTELDAIANEDIVESLGKSKKEAKEVVKISSKLKVRFRAYLNKSRLIFQNPYMDSELTMGYNGRADLRLSKAYSTGTRATVNYQFSNKLLVTFIDQDLVQNVLLRVSSITDPENENASLRNNNTMQVIYSKGF